MVSLVGGGSGRVRPGEVSLAHRGALFLDELPEFPVHALEVVAPTPRGARGAREPRRRERPSSPPTSSSWRARTRARAGVRQTSCKCGDVQRTRYARRLSAPLLDRFDLRIKIEDAGHRSGRIVGGRRGAGRGGGRSATRRGYEARRGGATRTSRPARWSATSVSVPTTRARRGSGSAKSANSPVGARRASAASRARIADLDDRTEIEAGDIDKAAWMREDLW